MERHEIEHLNRIDFVDLYLGSDYCDLKCTSPGQVFKRSALPEADQSIVLPLRALCEREHKIRLHDEFGLRLASGESEVIYRVTVINDARGFPVYVLRKSNASLRPLGDIGLPPHATSAIDLAGLTGLVLFVGETASGKTTSVGSVVQHRLRKFGGVGLTIEQPIEVPLEGLHGDGRCIQHEISREEDEYAKALNRSLRTNPNLIMLGEVRHVKTAAEAVLAGMNGHLILSTLHANSIENGIDRFATLAAMGLRHEGAKDARSLVASSLSLVVHQRFQASSQAPRLMTRALSLLDERSGGSARSKIREGRVSALNQEIDQQQTQAGMASNSFASRR